MVANTLGLEGDGDDVEMLESVERSFAVTITNQEAPALYTAGDLFDLLSAKLSPQATNRKCAGAMAFYRLRRALADYGVEAKAKPERALGDLKKGYTKTFVKTLEAKSGLNLPKPALSLMGWTAVWAIFIAIVGSLLLFIVGIGLHMSHWNTDWVGRAIAVLMLVVAPLGVLVVSLDRGRLPRSCATLGDLANETARLSFGLLLGQGADNREETIWRALTEVLADHSASVQPGEITRETYLLRSTWKKAGAAA